jgi:uncharacterized protein YndB with AHSA1/START domain
VKRDLRFEAVYSNGLEEVWHALTDSGSLADWLMENDFKPLPGHKFHFRSKSRLGVERLIPCEVRVVDEPRLLSWNWGDEGSVVTFRLEAITGGTRLILEHRGLKGLRGLALAWVLSHGWSRKIDRRLPAVLAHAASKQMRNEYRRRP